MQLSIAPPSFAKTAQLLLDNLCRQLIASQIRMTLEPGQSALTDHCQDTVDRCVALVQDKAADPFASGRRGERSSRC